MGGEEGEGEGGEGEEGEGGGEGGGGGGERRGAELERRLEAAYDVLNPPLLPSRQGRRVARATVWAASGGEGEGEGRTGE